jgi:hypothetical protein
MMHIAEHVLKEGAEIVMRTVRRRINGRSPDELSAQLEAVHRYGISVIEHFWPADRCATAVAEIEHGLREDRLCKRWTDDEGADHRLFFAERLGGELARFHADPTIEAMRRAYTGVRQAETLLLAARLAFVKDNKGSGGGWHRDSPHRTQFKAILYLTDVDIESGPFEYVEGSHLAGHSLATMADGRCRPNQYRFTDEEARRLLEADTVPRTITGRAGTLLFIDSKGIHRGRPIERGLRYALTQYCFDGKRPRDFFR